MKLYHVYDKRDQLNSFSCGDCIAKHNARREGADIQVDYHSYVDGECRDSLHPESGVQEYPETHQKGYIHIERNADWGGLIKGDLGIQIAKDGRVWICIDGQAFLRFRPKEGIV